MVNKELAKYLSQQIKAGYAHDALKSHLINSGYSALDVDAAFNSLYPSKSSKKISKKMIIIPLAIVLILLIGGFFASDILLNKPKPKVELLSLKINQINEDLLPGETLEFNVELKNKGSSDGFSVFLRHEIVGTDIFLEEEIEVETEKNKVSKIKLSDDITVKKHTLKTTASYNNKFAFSTLTFSVISDQEETTLCREKWTCEIWLPEECPESEEQTRVCADENDCGRERLRPDTTRGCSFDTGEIFPQDDIINPVKVVPQDLEGKTVWEKLDIIKEKAKSNPSKALADCETLDVSSHIDECYFNIAEVSENTLRCDKIISERTKDKCLNNVAKVKGDSSICESVVKINRRDSCYMNFVNAKDYTVCENIDNSYLSDACFTLRKMPNVLVS